MTCTYSLQLVGLRGTPNNFGRAVLEVVVRTPRLLGTVRQKYSSEPFPVQAARGVAVHWTQAKAAKAHVRLRLLPGDGPADATAAAAVAAAQAQASVRGPGPAAAPDGSVAGLCRSGEGPLQLPLPLQPGGNQGQQQVTQLQLALPLEAEGATGAPAPPATVELDLVVSTDRAGGGDNTAVTMAGAAAVAASAPAVASGTSAPQAWAWTEVATAPAPAPEAAMQPAAAPRKRSWLLALGLGRHGGSGGGGGAAAAAAADVGDNRGATAVAAVVTAALGEGSSPATSVWDPVAALSSVTNTTATSAATATAATLSSSSQGAPGSLPAAPQREQAGEFGGSWAGRPPPPPGRRRLLSRPALPLPPSPFAPSSLAAASGEPSDGTAAAGATSTASQLQPQQQQATMASAASGCSEPQPPKRRRLGDFFARLFHPLSSHNQVRRIGGVEHSGASVGPTSLSETAAATTAAAVATPAGCGSPVSSVAPLSRLASGDAPGGGAATAVGKPQPHQLRRHGSLLGITPLTPPSPRLGDVYRVQDNALASDAGVQVGFGLGVADAAAGTAAPAPTVGDEARAGSGLLIPGLDSPGYGECSPAGGPDRLTVEPPVDDMAAASLASPMATSPDAAAAGGCFFWRYGAAARARAAQQAAGPALPPPAAAGAAAASGLGRAGSAPVPGVAPTCAGPPGSGTGRQLNTLSAADALPTAFSSSAPSRSSVEKAGQGQAQQQQAQAQQHSLGMAQGGEAHAAATAAAGAAAAAGSWSHPLEGEISRVMEFVGGQTGMSEDLQAVALSQCQFLLDCLRNPDMCWLVADSLLQLKHEVGFPFDTGVPIPGAPGWFRLVMQPMHPPPPPPAATAAPDGADDAAAAEGAVAAPPPPPAAAAALTVGMAVPSPEVLKVRWACIDQRQVGGNNACAAIGLEVATWCLAAVQRWRQAVAAAVAAASGGGGRRDSSVWPQPHPHGETAAAAAATGGGGGGSRREVAPTLSRSQRDRERERLASSVELESMSGAALEECIRAGTAVWQGVLVQSPAARVASSTGDFDLEHMLLLGGYSQRLRLAEYSAASLLEDVATGDGGSGRGGGGGTAPRRYSREGAAADVAPAAVDAAAAAAAAPQQHPHSAALAAAAASMSLLFPSPPERSSRAEPEGHAERRPPALQLASTAGSLQPAGSGVDHPPLTSNRGARHGSQCGVPTFAALVRSLQQGVYVLGWRGHFATLWLRPGGVVHLIDSLGARLVADCPLAFALEFDAPTDFLTFFLARHQARRDATAADDITGANMAALIEVHRLELM